MARTLRVLVVVAAATLVVGAQAQIVGAVAPSSVAAAEDGTARTAKTKTAKAKAKAKAKKAKAKKAKAKAKAETESKKTAGSSGTAAAELDPRTATITIGGTTHQASADQTCTIGGLPGPTYRGFWGTAGDLEVRIQVGGDKASPIVKVQSADESFDTWYEASASYSSEGSSVDAIEITKDGASGTATLVAPLDGGTTDASFAFRC